MTYEKTFTAKPEHVDVQGIMDGLFYPFYLEECRHSFAKEVLDFDIDEQARGGTNIVLSQYCLKFLRSLKAGDVFQVNCSAHKDHDLKPVVHFKQEMRREGKLIVSAIFTATCVLSTCGRSFLPEQMKEKLEQTEAVQMPAL